MACSVLSKMFSIACILALNSTASASFKCNQLFSERTDTLAQVSSLGRLAQFEPLLLERDTIGLELRFSSAQNIFNSSLAGLKSRGAHLIAVGFIGYRADGQFIKSIFGAATQGQGVIYLRLEKEELAKLRPFIELADELHPIRILTSDMNGVIRAERTFEQKLQSDDLAKWNEAVTKDQAIKITSMTSYSRVKFDNLVTNLKHENGISVDRVNFNDTQSMGFIDLSGPIADLKKVVERYPDIHAIQIAR